MRQNYYLLILFIAFLPVYFSDDAKAEVTLAESTFDTGLDGWTSNIPNDVSWGSSGGNPGGYFHFADQTAGDAWALAPATFLGNWSELDDTGKIYFDHRIIDPGPIGSINPYLVRIRSPEGYADWIGPTPTGETPWTSFVVPVDESAWTIQSGSWEEILSNVTVFGIKMELIVNSGGAPADIAGLDNVHVTNVPEPHTGVLVVLGALTLALILPLGRRCQKSNHQS